MRARTALSGSVKSAALLVTLLLVLAACGDGDNGDDGAADVPTDTSDDTDDTGDDDDSSDEITEDSVVFGTGAEGGVYAVAGAALCQLINDEIEGVTCSTQNAAGGVENERLVADGEVDFGLSSTDVAINATLGEGPFEGEEPRENTRVLTGGYPAAHHVLVRADSDIESLGDIAGRSMCTAPGNQIVHNELILEVGYGVSPDDFEAVVDEYGPCMEMLRQGQVDAALYNGSYPGAVIIEAMASREELRFLPVPPDVVATIAEDHPWYIEDTIPADAYDGLEEDVPSIATIAALVITRDDVSNGLVKALVKAIDENADFLESAHPTLEAFRYPELADVPVDEEFLPMHPGAREYYEEQGYL